MLGVPTAFWAMPDTTWPLMVTKFPDGSAKNDPCIAPPVAGSSAMVKPELGWLEHVRFETLDGMKVLTRNTPKAMVGLKTTRRMVSFASTMESLTIWSGIFAPAKCPKPVVDKLSKAMAKVFNDPEVIAKIEKAGLNPDYLDSVLTEKRLVQEFTTVTDIVQKGRIGKLKPEEMK